MEKEKISIDLEAVASPELEKAISSELLISDQEEDEEKLKQLLDNLDCQDEVTQ